MGMLRVAWFRNTKLKVTHMRKATVHFRFEKLSDSFKHVVKPTSNKPAIINIIHAMPYLFLVWAKVHGFHPSPKAGGRQVEDRLNARQAVLPRTASGHV